MSALIKVDFEEDAVIDKGRISSFFRKFNLFNLEIFFSSISSTVRIVREKREEQDKSEGGDRGGGERSSWADDDQDGGESFHRARSERTVQVQGYGNGDERFVLDLPRDDQHLVLHPPPSLHLQIFIKTVREGGRTIVSFLFYFSL